MGRCEHVPKSTTLCYSHWKTNYMQGRKGKCMKRLPVSHVIYQYMPAMLLVITLLALAGCADELIQSAPTSVPVVAPIRSVLPSITPLNMPSSTPTNVPPTPTVAMPPSPTLAPLPILVPPTPNPPPPSRIITIDTVGQIRRVGQIGFGQAQQVAIAPGDTLVAVGTTAGVAWFELPSLNHLRFDAIANGVGEISFSPSGRLMATLQRGADPTVSTVTVRQVSDGVLLATLEGSSLAFSPDELMLATMQSQGNAVKTQLWNSADGQPLNLLEGGYPAFSPNGQFVATVQGKQTSQPATLLWRSVDGTLLLDLPGDMPTFNPNGQMLATVTSSEIALWSMPDGKPAGTLRPPSSTLDGVQMAFSPDGRLLRAVAGGSLHIWDVTNGTLVDSFTNIIAGSGLPDIGFSQSGEVLTIFYAGTDGASGAASMVRTEDGSVLFADEQSVTGAVNTDGSLAVLVNPAGRVSLVNLLDGSSSDMTLQAYAKLAVDSDGQVVATANQGTRVYRWRSSDGELLQELDVPGGPVAGRVPLDLRYSVDGRLLIAREAFGSAGTGVATTIWDPQAGTIGTEVWRATRGDNLGLAGDWAYHPLSGMLAWVDGVGRVLLRTSDGNSLTLTEPGSVSALTFRPDASLVVLGDQAGTVQLLKTEGGYIYDTLQAGGPVAQMQFSLDGTLLGVQRSDGVLVVFRVDQQSPVLQLVPENGYETFAFVADNQMVITGGAGGVIFYRLSDGQLLSRLDLVAQDMAISASGRLLAVLHDGVATLWGVP